MFDVYPYVEEPQFYGESWCVVGDLPPGMDLCIHGVLTDPNNCPRCKLYMDQNDITCKPNIINDGWHLWMFTHL